ncbi:MAG TPA: hypothetical protein PK490_18160 [Prosthecobacter sp.]|nr:hypothetical protein [Prosthecobacter sp.]HRK16213.1 hypothetical protein [Prosthecobacter sp.]
MTTSQPIPKNLREQLVDSIVAMSEEQLLALHNAILDVEIERLRNELSEQAEQEQAEGKWDNLQGFIQEYRQRKKSERMKS